MSRRGFTLVELLVVIAIIGLLAGVVLGALSTANNRAKISRAQGEMKQLVTAMQYAKISNGSTLIAITGSGCTRCGGLCTTSGDLKGSTGTCYTTWVAALNTVQAKVTDAFNNLSRFTRDPWGSPYILDENEGESGGCNRDQITSYGPDGTSGGGDDFTVYVQNTTAACAN